MGCQRAVIGLLAHSTVVVTMLSKLVISLFEVKVFSDAGSSEFVKEQATYIFFTDLLEELEGILLSL